MWRRLVRCDIVCATERHKLSRNFSFYKEGSSFRSYAKLVDGSTISFKDVYHNTDTYVRALYNAGLVLQQLVPLKATRALTGYAIPEYWLWCAIKS